MKKAGILIAAFVLVASMMTACGCSSGSVTTDPTTNNPTNTTQSTKTTAPTTAPTTAATQPSADDMMPGDEILPDPTDATSESGEMRGRKGMPMR